MTHLEKKKGAQFSSDLVRTKEMDPSSKSLELTFTRELFC